MAEIPVTKKSGIPWWVWAILAALVVLLLVLFLGGDDDAEVTEVDREVEVVETAGTAGAITSLATLAGGTPALAGRQVDLTGVTVDTMYGDRGFTVTEGGSEPVFVVLDEVVPGRDDGDVDVNAGQVIDVRGEVFEVTDGRVNDEPIEGLPAGTDIIVYASEVAIEER